MAKKVVGLRALQAIIADAETKLVVIDVGATWCGPCRIIAPLFESLASEMNHAVFVKVDADESPDVISYFEVKAFPSFLFLRSGNEIERLVGADQPSLSRLVKQLSIKPEPKSTFSFPPPRFVFLAQQGTYAGIATFILSKLKDKHLTGAEAAKLAAVSTSTDENAATALLVREPGVTSKMLCDLLSMLDEEFQFAVVHLIAKMLSSEQGANALALMSGTALSILGQRLPDLAFKVQTITSPKGLQNRHGLAVEGWFCSLLRNSF
jgi:thiol-disulfide isomerase/thioredoxin